MRSYFHWYLKTILVDHCLTFGCSDLCSRDEDGEPFCSCPADKGLTDDQKTCIEPDLALAAQNCPSHTCWTWEDEKCKLKDSALDQCHTYLSCFPDMMDFRFDMETLIGKNMVNKLTTDTTCPLITNEQADWSRLMKLGNLE